MPPDRDHRRAREGAEPEPAAVVLEGGGAYERGPDGSWRGAPDGEPVAGAGDLTLGELFQPDLGEVDGAPVRLVPRAWASRRPDHPLAWAFEHADLGGRGPIPVPAEAWEARSGQVVAMSAPALHPWNLVGTDGVAAILGVNEATVRAYLARRQMPEPLVRIGRTPVWSRHQIEAWHATRTRARPTVHTPRPAPEPEDARGPEPDDDHDRDAGGGPNQGRNRIEPVLN
jgi:predicted DNA-binding transcriptional regulator AlpA